MVEQQVQVEVVAAHLQVVLAANEREAFPQFQQEAPDVFKQAAFQIPLVRLTAEREEVEVVRVFEKLLGEVGLRRRQGTVEVVLHLTLTRIKIGVDLVDEDIAAPPVLDGLPHVPLPFRRVLCLVQQSAIVEPGDLSSKLLDDCFIGVRRRESPHIQEIRA